MTTHTNNVSVPGWSGAGYIVINPQTGDGAYLISGGANGAFLSAINSFFWMIVASGLGATDALTNPHANKNYYFFAKLKYLAKMAGVSKFLGIVALIVSSTQIFSNDNLTYKEKALQISLNVMSYLATNILLKSLLRFNPIMAMIFGAIIAGIVVSIASYLASTYMTIRLINKKIFYVNNNFKRKDYV